VSGSGDDKIFGALTFVTSCMIVGILDAALERDTRSESAASEDGWKYNTVESRFPEPVKTGGDAPERPGVVSRASSASQGLEGPKSPQSEKAVQGETAEMPKRGRRAARATQCQEGMASVVVIAEWPNRLVLGGGVLIVVFSVRLADGWRAMTRFLRRCTNLVFDRGFLRQQTKPALACLVNSRFLSLAHTPPQCAKRDP